MKIGYCAECDEEQMMWDIRIDGINLWRCFNCRTILSRDFKFQIKINIPYTKEIKENVQIR